MTETITILAVDDQPANLRLLDAVLSPRGYRVVHATSGEQALELLRSSGVDQSRRLRWPNGTPNSRLG
jgi:CheY-like chemotaxis protein